MRDAALRVRHRGRGAEPLVCQRYCSSILWNALEKALTHRRVADLGSALEESLAGRRDCHFRARDLARRSQRLCVHESYERFAGLDLAERIEKSHRFFG